MPKHSARCTYCGDDAVSGTQMCNRCLEVSEREEWHCPMCLGNNDSTKQRTIKGVVLRCCDRCAEEMILCEYCGGLHHQENSRKYQGKCICVLCVQRCKLKYCRSCEKYFSFSDMHSSKMYCKECAADMVNCTFCGMPQSKQKATVKGEHTLCSRCTKNFTHVCGGCGEEVLDLITNTTSRLYGDYGYYCSKCRMKKGLVVIERYNYTPATFQPRGEPEGGLFFGVENEISVGDGREIDSLATHIAKSLPSDLVYTVHDGTVYNGFETVIHPLAFEEFARHGLEKLFHKDMVNHTSCGMHVHMSKSAFKQDQLYRFLRFFHANHNFISFVAERDYAATVDYRDRGRKMCKKGGFDTIASKAEAMSYPDKYLDVNLRPKDTIEVRVFQGVTSFEQMMKNIEFLHALFWCCMGSTGKILKLDSFMRYVVNNEDKYPNFSKYLSSYDAEKDYSGVQEEEEEYGPVGTINIGTLVELLPRAVYFQGRGAVNVGDRGRVTHISPNGNLRIDFPGYEGRGWIGREDEVGVVPETAAGPNYTSRIEPLNIASSEEWL